MVISLSLINSFITYLEVILDVFFFCPFQNTGSHKPIPTRIDNRLNGPLSTSCNNYGIVFFQSSLALHQHSTHIIPRADLSVFIWKSRDARADMSGKCYTVICNIPPSNYITFDNIAQLCMANLDVRNKS